MSLEITSNYGSYAAQSTASNRINGGENNKESSIEESNTGKEDKISDYLKGLQRNLTLMKLETGNSFSKATGSITHTIVVNPKLLEKMQNDPQAEKEYVQKLKDIEGAAKYVNSYFHAKGTVVYHNDQWYIDEKGNYSHFAQIVIKDELNEKLRKESRENIKKLEDRTREKATEKKKDLKEKLDNVKDEKKELEESDEKQTINDRAQKLLDDKLSDSADGKFYLNNEEVKTLMEAIKETEKASGNKNMEDKSGGNIDIKV